MEERVLKQHRTVKWTSFTLQIFKMKGVWFSSKAATRYEIKDFDIPTPGDDEILVKNVAVASNPKDWKVGIRTCEC